MKFAQDYGPSKWQGQTGTLVVRIQKPCSQAFCILPSETVVWPLVKADIDQVTHHYWEPTMLNAGRDPVGVKWRRPRCCSYSAKKGATHSRQNGRSFRIEVLEKEEGRIQLAFKNRILTDKMKGISDSSNSMDFRVCQIDLPARIVRHVVGR